MNKPADDFFEELERFLNEGEPVEDQQIQNHSDLRVTKDFDLTGVCEQEVYPLIDQILAICNEEGLAAQFTVFSSASDTDGVKCVVRGVNVTHRPETLCAVLVYSLPHALAHFILGVVQSPVTQMQMTFGGDESPDNLLLDQDAIYKSRIRKHVQALMSLVEDHKIPVQWGIVTTHSKKEKIIRGGCTPSEHFSGCQMTAAAACYQMPLFMLEDLVEIGEAFGCMPAT